MEVSCSYTDAVFSPADVHEMTTVTPLLQRAWRQRGFLGDRKYGRSGFAAREVAQIMALRYLGQSLRTDLEFIQKGVARAAPHILWFALGDPLAWDIQGTPAQVAAFNKAILAEDFFGFQYLDKMVGLKRGSVERFLVRTDTSDVLTSNLEDILIGDRPPLGGIVLDLMAAGKELREKAKRPLIIVSDIEILDQPAPTSATRGARSTRR